VRHFGRFDPLRIVRAIAQEKLAFWLVSEQIRRAREVATTTLFETTREAPRICITDPRRSHRNLYIRLETWLSRALWDGLGSVDPFGYRAAVWGEMHYIRHLRKKRPPCPACAAWTLRRF